MTKLPAQFVKHTGPMNTGEHRLTFDVQREFASLLYQALEQLELNPQIMLDITIVRTKKEASDAIHELEDNLWTRQNKKIHALLDELTVEEKKATGYIKKEIKQDYINRGIIKSSLKELDEKKQETLLNYLEERLINAKFND